MNTLNSQLLADTHASHRLVTLNLQFLTDTQFSHRLVTPKIQLLADTHVSHHSKWLLQIFSYWLIHMSAIIPNGYSK